MAAVPVQFPEADVIRADAVQAAGADGTGVDDVDGPVMVDVLDVVVTGQNRQRMAVSGGVQGAAEIVREAVLMDEDDVGTAGE